MKKERPFSEYKERILEQLGKLDESSLGINEPVSLFEGFFQSHYTEGFSGNTVLGGKYIPTIAVIGEETGRLYFFAIKKILPSFPEIE